MALKLGTFPDSLRIGNANERLHLHRLVCDLDSVRDQADGEPQYEASVGEGVYDGVME